MLAVAILAKGRKEGISYMSAGAMTSAVQPATDPRTLPIDRGFDEYVANLYQWRFDNDPDKNKLIDYLRHQADVWKRWAERSMVLEDDPVFPFPASDVISWLKQAVVRAEALDDRELARRSAKLELLFEISELKVAVEGGDLEEAASISRQVQAAVKELARAHTVRSAGGVKRKALPANLPGDAALTCKANDNDPRLPRVRMQEIEQSIASRFPQKFVNFDCETPARQRAKIEAFGDPGEVHLWNVLRAAAEELEKQEDR